MKHTLIITNNIYKTPRTKVIECEGTSDYAIAYFAGYLQSLMDSTPYKLEKFIEVSHISSGIDESTIECNNFFNQASKWTKLEC
jgi:hypothetical protein|tara:strand:+ start:625 stop:876 length:252 start_codon:yes stop_codon:yes gene_type:complete